jgi:hypothetical protein
VTEMCSPKCMVKITKIWITQTNFWEISFWKKDGNSRTMMTTTRNIRRKRTKKMKIEMMTMIGLSRNITSGLRRQMHHI